MPVQVEGVLTSNLSLKDGQIVQDGDLTIRVEAFNFEFSSSKQRFSGSLGNSVSDNSINYIWVDGTGSLNISTTGFPIDQHLPLARVFTTGSVITAIRDERAILVTASTGTLGPPGAAGASLFFSDTANLVEQSGSLEMSGSGHFKSGLTGALNVLSDGSPFLLAGTNVTLSTGSNGAVTINSEVDTSMVLLQGFTDGNNYEGSASMYGSTDGFLVSVLFEYTNISSDYNNVMGNFAYPRGWEINVNPLGGLAIYLYNDSSTLRDYNGTAYSFLGDSFAVHPAPKHWLFTLRVYLTASVNRFQAWNNGVVVADFLVDGLYEVATSGPKLGAGLWGARGPDISIAGFAYKEGTVTDKQLVDHFFSVYEANDFVDGGLGWDTIYSVKRGNPTSTWVPSDGTGETLVRNGSLTAVTRSHGFFG